MKPYRYASARSRWSRVRAAIERAGGYAVLPGSDVPSVCSVASAALRVDRRVCGRGWPPPDGRRRGVGQQRFRPSACNERAPAWEEAHHRRGRRVADAVVTNQAVLAAHAVRNLALLLAMGGWMPLSATATSRSSVPPRRGVKAIPAKRARRDRRRSSSGVGPLEPTYTAKAFASTLDRARSGRRAVFVQTYAGGDNEGSSVTSTYGGCRSTAVDSYVWRTAPTRLSFVRTAVSRGVIPNRHPTLRSYQNEDGGFGNASSPDLARAGQPIHSRRHGVPPHEGVAPRRWWPRCSLPHLGHRRDGRSAGDLAGWRLRYPRRTPSRRHGSPTRSSPHSHAAGLLLCASYRPCVARSFPTRSAGSDLEKRRCRRATSSRRCSVSQLCAGS